MVCRRSCWTICKEARERLRQNPHHSSRPPSSRAPWERPSGGGGDEEAIDAPSPTAEEAAPDEADADATRPLREALGSPDPPASAYEAPETEKPNRQAGKQPGAPGIGRTQVLSAHERRQHRPPDL